VTWPKRIVLSRVGASSKIGAARGFAPITAYLDRLDRTRTARNLVRRLAAMGFDVQLQEKAA
jgi:hypothetical protein